jgi:hypothetical protein
MREPKQEGLHRQFEEKNLALRGKEKEVLE